MKMKKLVPLLALGFLFSNYGMAATSEQDKANLGVSTNRAANGGAENGKAGWTVSGTSAAIGNLVVDTTNKFEGNAGFAWTPANADNYLSNANVSIASSQGLSGRNCAAAVWTKTAATSHALEAYDGTNVLASVAIPASTSFQPIALNFPCPASGTVRVRLNAGSTTVVYFDSLKWGDANGINLSQVSQASLIGSITFSGCTAAGWSTTSVSYVDPAATTGCSYTTMGAVSPPGTMVPQFTISNVPPGNYLILTSGLSLRNNGGGSMYGTWARLTDGTNNGPDEVGYTVTDVGQKNFPAQPQLRPTYSTAQSSVTIKLQIKADNGTAVLEPNGLTFSVYRFPLSSEIAFRTDQVGWFASASISGTAIMGIGTDGGFVETTNASLTLTQDSGSIQTFIACANGTDSSGTTCGVNESVGFAFTMPLAGPVEVCAEFTNRVRDDMGSAATDFKVVETANSSTSVLTDTTWVTSGPLDSEGTGEFSYQEVNLCRIFNLSSSGKKTFRVMRQITNAADSDNDITNITFRAKPIAQAIAAPLVIGSVTSNTSGQERVERAEINCDAASSITSQSGSWISAVGNIASAACTVTIASGIFSGNPSCTATVRNCSAPTGAACFATFNSQITSTSMIIAALSDTGAQATVYDTYIICMGPR